MTKPSKLILVVAIAAGIASRCWTSPAIAADRFRRGPVELNVRRSRAWPAVVAPVTTLNFRSAATKIDPSRHARRVE